MQDDYRPLQHQHNAQRAALVQLFDHAYDPQKLTKGERAKIMDMPVNACFDLPEKGFLEVQPILDKYAPPPTAEQERAFDLEAAEMMKQLWRQ